MKINLKNIICKFMGFSCIVHAGISKEQTLSVAVENYIQLEKDAIDFGFNWPDAHTVLDQVASECQEIKEAATEKHDTEHLQEEIGDLIQSVLSLCLELKFDVYETLQKANEKFAYRIAKIKELTYAQGVPNLHAQSVAFKLDLWKEVVSLKNVSAVIEKGVSAIEFYEKLNKEAVDFGFNWPNGDMVLDKTLAEINAVKEALKKDESITNIQEKVGDLVQVALAVCLFYALNIEETLQKVNEKFFKRMNNLKILTKEQGMSTLKNQSLSFKLDLWEQAKEIL